MDRWYSIVRTFLDESEKPFKTKQFVDRVFQDLNRLRVREKNKFKERTGIEFDSWVEKLEQDYPPLLVREILNDDDFWLETLKVAKF
jgi:hypothetical protein